MKYLAIFLLVVSFFLLSSCNGSDSNEQDAMRLYRDTVERSQFMLHALGGDSGRTYVNSVEVLSAWYNRGARLYETDVWETSDGKLVLTHRNSTDGSLSKSDCERLGLEYPADPTFEEFMRCKVWGHYPTSSFQDLVDFMAQHDDLYVMIDIQNRSYADTKALYGKIYDVAYNGMGGGSVLDRFIAGGWTSDMIRACRDVYDFKILNLYWAAESQREFKKAASFISYCKKNGITSFSTSTGRFKEDSRSIEILIASGLISYVFTINDVSEYADFMLEYPDVNCIGTDLLGAVK